MAILFMDSVDGLDGSYKFTAYSPSSVNAGVSPTGRYAYRTGNSGTPEVVWAPPSAVSTMKVSFYGRASNLNSDASANGLLFQFRGPTATVHMNLSHDVNGACVLRFLNGGGTFRASSANGTITANVWHHYEVWCQVADSGGRYVLYVDGSEVINFTGDTRNGGSDTTLASCRWGRVVSGSWDFCDIVVADDTNIIGPADVWLHLPNGNGNTSNLDGSDANQTDNYLLVDEATPNDDTDYVTSDTQGDFDLYTLSDLPSGTWDVLAVQTTIISKTDDGGAKFVRPVIRSGGSNATGASVAVPASYDGQLEVFEENPVTVAAWTASEVNALEVGPEVRDS